MSNIKHEMFWKNLAFYVGAAVVAYGFYRLVTDLFGP